MFDFLPVQGSTLKKLIWLYDSIAPKQKNLLNTKTNTTGYYISATGVISADDSTPKSQYTDLIPVTAGKTYTWTLTSNRATAGNDRCHGYKSDGTWKQQVGFASADPGGAAFSLTVTIPSGVYYVRLSYGIDDTDAKFVLDA